MNAPQNPVGWFEIPVTDMERAKKFYTSVFQHELSDMPMGGMDPDMQMAMFPMNPGGPNSGGALVKSSHQKPVDGGTLVYFSCQDVNDELARVEAAGGSIIMPKQSLGEYGNMGLIKDTEGNTVGLHSMS